MTKVEDAKPAVRATGSCLCGAVRYEVAGPLRDVVECHCAMCRKTHGHIGAYTATPKAGLGSPEFVVNDNFADMWTSALAFCQKRFEGQHAKYRNEPSGGIGCFTPDGLPVFDRFRDNVYGQQQSFPVELKHSAAVAAVQIKVGRAA